MAIKVIDGGGYDHEEIEKESRTLWEDTGIYNYDPDDTEREVFSIDTPPPYVSAAHLHVGHAMSYSQADPENASGL